MCVCFLCARQHLNAIFCQRIITLRKMCFHWTCIVSVFRKASLKMTTGLADIARNAGVTTWTCAFVYDLISQQPIQQV